MVGRVFGNQLAAVKHVDPAAKLGDEAHIVLDQEHAFAISSEAPENFGQRVAFDIVHAGDRFVEQDEIGLGRQRPHHLDPALMAVGQAAGRIIGLAGHVETVEQLEGAAPEVGDFPRGGRQAEQRGERRRALVAVEADHHVVDDAGLAQQADVLEGSSETGTADFVGRRVGDVGFADMDGAIADRQHAGDHVDDGGLAGAVRTDQPGDLAGRNLQIGVLRGDHAAEILGQAGQRQRAHASASRRFSRRALPRQWLCRQCPWEGS